MVHKNNIDIHNFPRQLKRHLKYIDESHMSKRNKSVLMAFYQDWKWKKKGLNFGIARVCKYFIHMRVIAEILNYDDFATESEIKEYPLLEHRDFDYITEEHSEKIIECVMKRNEIDKDWTISDYIVIFKRFMKWFRLRYGYPSDYPDYDMNTKLAKFLNHPTEVANLKHKAPKYTKTKADIPRDWELEAIYKGATHPRDKAFFAMWNENPNRIGGLGALQCKNFKHDDLGYEVTMYDKTMNGETVRFVKSQWDITNYIAWLKNNQIWEPDNPFWIDLDKFQKGILTYIRYPALKAMLLRAQKRYNRMAHNNPEMREIERHITFHVARYTATRRYRKEGKPDWFIEQQMGWVPGSDRIAYYGRLFADDRDEYLKRELGMEEEKEKPIQCPRCYKENPPGSEFCRFCRSPLSLEIAVNVLKEKEGARDEMTEVNKKLSELEYKIYNGLLKSQKK